MRPNTRTSFARCIKPTGAAALLALALALAAAAPPGQAPPAVADQLAGLDLLRGPWDDGPVHRESLLFLKGADGVPRAKLLYDVDRILIVAGASGETTYEAGRDFTVAPDHSGLELPPGSRIPFLDESDLFRPKGAANSIAHRAGSPDVFVLFDNAAFFHHHQVEASYLPRRPEWNAYRPTFAGGRLPNTIAKLRARQPLTIAVSGDSISEGYNASEYTRTAPFMPPYPTLVAAQLEQTYGSKVALHNKAVAGWSSGKGAQELHDVLACRPDLVIIAYGMNDVGARDPEGFKANIETMLRRIRADSPATEVVLVATMTGNPDWVHTPAEMFPIYREALASLEGPGVALADLTSVWLRTLERKRHTDLTGNGVNHPNDHGHRLYARTILALLAPPAAPVNEEAR